MGSYLSEEEYALLRRLKCQELTDDQFLAFRHAIERYRLNPFGNQIYFQLHMEHRTGRRLMNVMTGIDGYRLIADRTGRYAGNDDPVFDDEESPRRATVTVYKMVNGVRCAFTASARWDEYYPGDALGAVWRKRRHLMLGKCAEALALRKAFPAELSGLYTTEEMEGVVVESEVSGGGGGGKLPGEVLPVAAAAAVGPVAPAVVVEESKKSNSGETGGGVEASAAAAAAVPVVESGRQKPTGVVGRGGRGFGLGGGGKKKDVRGYVLSRIEEARRNGDVELLGKIGDWLSSAVVSDEVRVELRGALESARSALSGEVVDEGLLRKAAEDEWTIPIMSLKRLEDVMTFRERVLPTVPESHRGRVEEMLVIHQLTLETSVSRCVELRERYPGLERQIDARIRELKSAAVSGGGKGA